MQKKKIVDNIFPARKRSTNGNAARARGALAPVSTPSYSNSLTTPTIYSFLMLYDRPRGRLHVSICATDGRLRSQRRGKDDSCKTGLFVVWFSGIIFVGIKMGFGNDRKTR